GPWIVRLASGEKEEQLDGDHRGGGGAESVLPPQPYDAHDHKGNELRTNQKHLLYPVQNRTVGIAAMLKRVRNTVPVMTELPGDVRQQQEDSDGEAKPRPSTGEEAALPGHQQTDEHGHAQPDHRVFRLQANPEDEPE